jgi:hypothetical protein
MSSVPRPVAPKTPVPSWLVNGVPTMETEDERVKEYMERLINPLSPRRRWHTQRAAMHLWAYLGRQWILPMGTLAPGEGSYHFSEIVRNSEAAFPRPVTNLCAPAVDNEVSRLTRKELVPDTSVSRNQPEWMAAARLAKDIVKWEMSKQMWPDKREETAFNLCVDGTVGLRTWWDENNVDLSIVAPPDSRQCPSCGRKFASARVPATFASLGLPAPEGPTEMLHKETLRPGQLMQGEATAMFPQGIELAEMTHCPYCAAPTPLNPYMVSELEAAREEDVFGRQMGLAVPRGEGLLDTVSLHDYYPENGGIGVEPHEQRMFGQMSVRPLEWIATRFEELADDLHAEEPAQLIKLNPLYADRIMAGTQQYGGGAVGLEVYPNHARVRELTVLPQVGIAGLERGAWFIMVGAELIRRELCIEVPTNSDRKPDETRLVPRVKYHFARFKRVPKNFYGWTFLSDLLPINRRLNELDAQVVDLRERGVPNMWGPAGLEIHTREDVAGSMRYIEYDAAGTAWTPRDGIFPGVALAGNEYFQERRSILEDARMVGLPQDIEIGGSPGSVKTTSGLMLIAEEAGTKRGPRERSLGSMYESAFDHVLEMNHAFRQEESAYEVVDQAGQFEIKSFTGSDLLPNTRVKMTARAGYDIQLYNKEAAAEGMQLGLYTLDSPAAKDRILDLMKLPKDVNENQTLQIQRAEMAWADFRRDMRVPAIDQTIYDPLTWYSVLGKRWFDDDCLAMQRTAGWEQIIHKLNNWPQKMAEIEAQEAPVKAIYGKIPKEQWLQVYQQGEEMTVQANQNFQAASTRYAALPPQDQQMMPPPQPPPFPSFPKPPLETGFLPEVLELKIYEVWRRMTPELQMGVKAAESLEDAKGGGDTENLLMLDALMQMRAVIEAFRLMLQGPAAGAMPPGAPPPGAPPGAGPPPPPGGPMAAGGPPPGAPPGA